MSFRNQNEDLFQDSRMSFGEHLEELRKVLIRSLIGVAIGCVIGFLYAEQVVKVLQVPLENALTKYYVNAGKDELQQEVGYIPPELSFWFEQDMIPETVLIDPGQLVAALRSVSPDFLQSVPLEPYRFTRHQFSAEEVKTICENWSQLKVGNKEQEEQFSLLWSLIEEKDRSRITGIAANSSIQDSDIQEFVRILNRLLLRSEIANATEFLPLIEESEFSITTMLDSKKPNALLEMKQRLEKNFDNDLLQRLNRLIVSKCFRGDTGDVKLEMTPITIWQSARFQSQSLGATETFMIWVKAGVVAGLVISCPWVFFQLWTFVAAGLYPAEQKYVYVFLPISLALFFSGVFLAFFFVFEPVLDFLFSFNARMGISPQPRINDWLSFVLFLPLGFGVAFQLPLVMLFANRVDLISVEAYTSKWRVAVVAIFGLSMLLTPADPVSMIMLAIPLTALYFLGIFLCHWLNKPANPFDSKSA